jgi:hypothetical protein
MIFCRKWIRYNHPLITSCYDFHLNTTVLLPQSHNGNELEQETQARYVSKERCNLEEMAMRNGGSHLLADLDRIPAKHLLALTVKARIRENSGTQK